MGFAVTGHGGHYNGRVTLFVILSCMMAAMGGVIFGYDIGISGLDFKPLVKFLTCVNALISILLPDYYSSTLVEISLNPKNGGGFISGFQF